MHFLAIIKRKTDPALQSKIDELLDPEAQYVRELYGHGIFRSVWSRADVKGAVIELECASRDEAAAVVANLPFARAGLVETEIISLLPYRGFAPPKV